MAEPEAELSDDPPQGPPRRVRGEHRRDELSGDEWLVQLDARGHVGSFEGAGARHDVCGQLDGRIVSDVRHREDVEGAEGGGGAAGFGKGDDRISRE